MFKAEIHGESIMVNNGRLTGDFNLVRLLEIEAEIMKGYKVGPSAGPFTVENHLASDLSAWFLLLQVFGDENVELIEGVINVPLENVGVL